MPLIFHWGGPRHGEVDDIPDEAVRTSVLVYDGPRWLGVYEPSDPPQVLTTAQGKAEVWLVRE